MGCRASNPQKTTLSTTTGKTVLPIPSLLECCSPFTIQQALPRHRIRTGCHRLQPACLTTQSSKVRFTRLKVGNEEIFPGNEYLPLDIAVSKAIRIHEREKSFSLEFSALNYESDNTATYSYRLLGFDNRWIHVPASRRFATYTNLSPGNYTLQVKYTPYTPTGEDNITELEITIQPYFYKTTWFILLVIILATFATWQFYQWRIRSLKEQKARLHQKVEQRTHELKKQKQLLEEQTEELSRQNRMLKQQNEKITRQKAQLTKMTRKIQELTLDKIAFFTNITHEFRTPITLIIADRACIKVKLQPSSHRAATFRGTQFQIPVIACQPAYGLP